MVHAAISIRCQRAIEAIFSASDATSVSALLASRCGEDLPLLIGNPAEIERVQMAVLKLSGGSISRLMAAIHEARSDWRDVLIAAFPNASDALVWDPATHPFPREIALSEGRVLGELRGVYSSTSRSQCFQFRLAGCPYVRDRLFAADWLVSEGGEYLALLEVAAPDSEADAPTVLGAAVVRPGRRTISSKMTSVQHQVSGLLALTSESLRVSIKPDDHQHTIDIATLLWTALY